MVDPQDLADQRIAVAAADTHHAGLQARDLDVGTDLTERHAVAEVRGHGPEDVAPVEGRPRRGHVVGGIVQNHRTGGATDHGHRRREETVVGPDQYRLAVTDFDGDSPAIGADTGIDDGDDHTGNQVLAGPWRAPAPLPGRRSDRCHG